MQRKQKNVKEDKSKKRLLKNGDRQNETIKD